MIMRTIGQGGMGAVYLARDLRRQTTCAIKEMSLSMVPDDEQEQAIGNFKAEAEMLARLSHPNLPTFSGYFTEGQRHFLVMEYVDGHTLEDLLEHNNGPFSEKRVLGWAQQLCDVLAYLHSQHPPIIFRDMKPGNIMLARNGRIKLIDFGIARFFRQNGAHDTRMLGTPGFAPPEQYGHAQTDERSDIYSLAMTLFQLMTNTLSEKGFGLKNVHSIHPAISLPVARALEKATAMEAEDRFQSVEMFRRALLGEGTFIFESGEQATTVQELADLCIRFPEEAADYLFAGEIEAWLRDIGDMDLVHATRSILARERDPDEVVDQFLELVLGPNIRVRTTKSKHTASKSSQTGKAPVFVAPTASRHSHWPVNEPIPDIVVQPRTLDFGEVEHTLSEPLDLTIEDNRDILTRGSIQVREPWIVLEQASFRGPHTRIRVRVDATHLRGAMHYSSTILVIPDEDDEEQDVEVKVEADVVGRIGVSTISTPSVNVQGGQAQGVGRSQEGGQAQGVGRSQEGGQAQGSPLLYDDEDMLAVSAEESDDVDDVSSANNLSNPKYSKYKAKYPTGSTWEPLWATPRQRLWMQRILTVFAAFMMASLCYGVLAGMPALVHTRPLPPNPWFIAVLLGMLPMAVLGALVINWKRTWGKKERSNGLCTGLCTALLALSVSEFAWQTFLRLYAPALQLMIMLLIAALASTVGTHPQISKRIIALVQWATGYARWVVIALAMAVGGGLGFMLTAGLPLTFLTPLSMVVGSGIVASLALWDINSSNNH